MTQEIITITVEAGQMTARRKTLKIAQRRPVPVWAIVKYAALTIAGIMLFREGADRAAFLDWESDLTADDGMTDYGTATDKIALLSDKLYRMFRGIIPRVDAWCWNLTPWTCDPEYSYYVRYVYSSGAVNWVHAYYGYYGVRPLCYLKSEILVSVPGEDDEEKNVEVAEEDRAQLVLIASDRILNALNEYPVEVWGEALGAAVASLFTSKQDAEQIAQEDKDKAAEV